jgi:hypothetical protein
VSQADRQAMMLMQSGLYYHKNVLSTERVVVVGEQLESRGLNTLLTDMHCKYVDGDRQTEGYMISRKSSKRKKEKKRNPRKKNQPNSAFIIAKS